MSKLLELPGFRSLAPLGRGGTAEVVRVFSKKYRRQLALKYPIQNEPQSSETFARLVQREDHLIGRLTFPGLVRVLEVSTDQPPFILMELCPGPTLVQCGRLDNLALALNVLSAVALNLEFLRANSIIHGDLKPHNIFLPSKWQNLDNDRLFYVKLSDFSLGRFSYEPDQARAGLGTVGFMAPETVAQSRATIQTDLFALGVIAYQLLTGVHPFMDDESDPVKINSRVREEEPIPLRSIRPDLPEDLVDLVERLLAKDEIRRPQSGWEVCQALRKTGARYPFEKALRPAHFFSNKNYRENTKAIIQATDRQWRRLDMLHDESDAALRLLLTVNFVKGSLHYDGHRFVFSKGIYWPAILRRNTLSVFQQSPFSHKRQIVKAAIVGGTAIACDLGIIDGGQLNHTPPSLPKLMQQLIRPRLLRRYSAAYASRAERSESYELAARLYHQAGELQGAERCAYQAAVMLNKEHNNEDAVGIINRVIEYAQMIGKATEIRQLLMTRGDIHKQNGDTDLALATYRQIIDLSRGIPPDKLLAETYKDLGDLYRMKQESEAGLKALHKALEIYKELGDELEISHTLNNIGNINWITSNLDAALNHYRRALRIQRRLKAPADIASTLGNIAMIYVIKGRFQRSIHLMNLSLRLKKEIGNAGEIARTLNNLGYAYHFSGTPWKAVSFLSEALKINRRIGSKKEILFNLENLAGVMTTAGQLKEVLPYLKEGMSLSEALSDKRHYAAFNLNIGTVLKRMGQFCEAEQHITTGEKITKEINDKMLAVDAAVRQAGLRYLLGDKAHALEVGETAFKTARQINDKSAQLNALLLITRASDETQFIEAALALADELHLKREKTLINFNVIESLVEQGKVTEAQVVSKRALPGLEQMSEDIELPWMCNVAAELMLAHNNLESALGYLSRAQRLANTSGLLPEMVTTLTLQGRINLSKDDYEQCYHNYKSALQICKKLVDNIEDEADRQLFQNKRSTMFLVNEIKRLGTLIGEKKGQGRNKTYPAPSQDQDRLMGHHHPRAVRPG
jgi:serine/threonine protein kinase